MGYDLKDGISYDLKDFESHLQGMRKITQLICFCRHLISTQLNLWESKENTEKIIKI